MSLKSTLRDVFGTLEEDPREAQRRRILAAAGLGPDGKPLKKDDSPASPTESFSPAASVDLSAAARLPAPADKAGDHTATDPAGPAAAGEQASTDAVPRPRGRRRIKVTPIYIREGMNVMAMWGGRPWRAEVVRVYLDHPLAAESVIEEAAGNAPPCAWRVDVRFASDETDGRGVLLTTLTHTNPDYHTLEVLPSFEASRRVIGGEIVARRVIATSETEAWRTLWREEMGHLDHALSTQRKRSKQVVEASESASREIIEAEEIAMRSDFSSAAVSSLVSAMAAAEMRQAHEAHERSRQQRRTAAALAVQGALRARISGLVRERILAKAAARVSRMVSIGVQAGDDTADRFADTTPSTRSATPRDAVEKPPVGESPRLAHFPSRRHHVSRCPTPISVRPPFRTTSLHPEIPAVDALPLPRSRRGSPARYRGRSVSPVLAVGGPGSAYGTPSRSRAATPPGTTTPIASAHGTPRRNRSPDRVVVLTEVTPRSFATPSSTFGRGPTPAKPSPLPQRYAQVPPRYAQESALKPQSLASYLRLARYTPQFK
jgi:hypothetical protein